MPKFRKKPVEIEAIQWFKLGDHPAVEVGPTLDSNCAKCGYTEHGIIDTLEGKMFVCPSNWIITGVKGEVYPCRADIFKMTYEAIEEA